MRLFLVQHGEATSEQEDPERPLTDRGAGDVRRVARAAAEAGLVTAARIVQSGKTRAHQTAEIWSKALGVPIEEADGLAPLDDPRIWGDRVAAGSVDLMLVGHLPHLAKLTGLLLVGDPDRAVIAFQQGGLVGLERGASGWSVLFVVPPAVLAAEGGGAHA
jgi:phosphohistidine phosphatase